MLNSSTAICGETYPNRKRGGLNTKERANTFSLLICSGEVGEAIRYIYERDTCEIILPGDVDEKTGDLVKEILESNHLEG